MALAATKSEILREWTPSLLVALCVAALPFARSVEFPIFIMSVAGGVLLYQGRAWGMAARTYTVLFLLIWIPILVSLPDAVEFDRTLKTAGAFLRLYLSGIFILWALEHSLAWDRVVRIIAWVLVVWIGDALIQAIVGHDIFGYAYLPPRLNGMFGEESFKLGLMLAFFSPFLIDHARRNWSQTGQALIHVAMLVVILLAGSRAAWLMYGVVLAGFFAMKWYEDRRLPRQLLLAGAVVLTASVVALHTLSAGFQTRAATTLLIFEGNEEAINTAVSWRLPIWGTSLAMIAEHPYNGVGARGFRYAYAEHAGDADPFLQAGADQAPTHAHQLYLEVAADTGVIGLAGLFGFVFVLGRVWWRAGVRRKRLLVAPALAMTAALFPLNTHLALYSSSWSQVVFLGVALFCAASALTHSERRPSAARASRNPETTRSYEKCA